jgi:uncharacterized protein YecT (DUF1311 family)
MRILSAVALCAILGACDSKETPVEQVKTLEASLATMTSTEQVSKACANFDTDWHGITTLVLALQQKNPAFNIQGNVTDTSETSLQIFGRAVVPPVAGRSHWASSGNERNIVVINPNNVIRNPSFYVGEHYFIRKDSGKNGFGAEVPVWVFGDPPEELGNALRTRKAVLANLGLCNSRLKALAQVVPATPSVVPPAPAVTTALPREDAASTKRIRPPSTTTWVPSFDCGKASSFAEKEVCANSLLGQLDGALSDNYKHMLASNIGSGARTELQGTQRKWLAERNRCSTSQCLTDLYRARVDQVCDYPVLSGIHPTCIGSDEIN